MNCTLYCTVISEFGFWKRLELQLVAGICDRQKDTGTQRMTSTVSVTVNNELLVEDDFWNEAGRKDKTERVLLLEEDEGKGNNGNVTDEGNNNMGA